MEATSVGKHSQVEALWSNENYKNNHETKKIPKC